MSSERRRDRRDDYVDEDAGQRSRQRQRRDRDNEHHDHHRDGVGGRRSSFEDDDRRRHQHSSRGGKAPSSLASGLKRDRDADEGLTFETSPGIVAVKSFEKMGLRVRLDRRKEKKREH